MGVPARQRLRKQTEFLKVRSGGRRIHCGSFIFQCSDARPDGGTGRRLGVIASRRVGNAVRRNYGKRIFRELFRRHQALLPEPSDTVIVLRSGFAELGFEQLEHSFLKACARMQSPAGGAER